MLHVASTLMAIMDTVEEVFIVNYGIVGAFYTPQNRKKTHPKPNNRRKIRSKPKTARKTVTTDTFHIPVIKTLIDPIWW